MKQKRTPKTADEKDLDTLWAVMRWAVDMRQTSLCHHVLRQIGQLDRPTPAADAPPPARRPGRPRKPKAEADQSDPGNGAATGAQLPLDG